MAIFIVTLLPCGVVLILAGLSIIIIRRATDQDRHLHIHARHPKLPGQPDPLHLEDRRNQDFIEEAAVLPAKSLPIPLQDVEFLPYGSRDRQAEEK